MGEINTNLGKREAAVCGGVGGCCGYNTKIHRRTNLKMIYVNAHGVDYEGIMYLSQV